MKVFSLKQNNGVPIALALGFFDSVHAGHCALLDKAKLRAAELDCLPCVITFENNPYALFGKTDKLIFTYPERLSIFKAEGMGGVVSVDFDSELMKTDRFDFLEQLRTAFELRAVICGHDYKFGAGGKGDARLLGEFCAKNNIMCDIIQPVLQNSQRISSTFIRSLISSGNMTEAAKLIGRNYFIDGAVCHGRGVGRLFDFPTANIECAQDKLLPQKGVYATYTSVDGKIYKSVTNVGDKPTFDESGFSVETMLTDFSGDLYGKTVRVKFVKYLRDIRKFSSPYELKARIYEDAKWSV